MLGRHHLGPCAGTVLEIGCRTAAHKVRAATLWGIACLHSTRAIVGGMKLVIPKHQALGLLQDAKRRAMLLSEQGERDSDFERWKLEAIAMFRNIFGDCDQYRSFAAIDYSSPLLRPSWTEDRLALKQGISLAVTHIEAAMEEIKLFAEEVSIQESQGEIAQPDSKKVFVIHGRNHEAVREMNRFLRALGLEPVNFKDLRATLGGTATIAEVVFAGMAQAQGVIALFTGDEYAALRPEHREEHEDATQIARWQGRPNVIFEAGMAFGRDRDRVVFVLLGAVELFSDVAGVHVLRPNNAADGDRYVLMRTLKYSLGCDINDSSAYMTEGDFVSCVKPRLATIDPFNR
jgi:predicted nucleotide-binding protein